MAGSEEDTRTTARSLTLISKLRLLLYGVQTAIKMAIMVRLWYVISAMVIVRTVAREYSANYLYLRVDGEFLCKFVFLKIQLSNGT